VVITVETIFEVNNSVVLVVDTVLKVDVGNEIVERVILVVDAVLTVDVGNGFVDEVVLVDDFVVPRELLEVDFEVVVFTGDFVDVLAVDLFFVVAFEVEVILDCVGLVDGILVEVLIEGNEFEIDEVVPVGLDGLDDLHIVVTSTVVFRTIF